MTYDSGLPGLRVRGRGIVLQDDIGDLRAPLEVLRDASATSLRQAVARYQHEHGGESTTVWTSTTPAAHFSITYSPLEPTALEVSPKRILLRTIAELRTTLTEDALENITRSFLEDAGASLLECDVEGEGFDTYWSVVYEVRSRGRTVEQLLAYGGRLEAFLGALDPTGSIAPDSIAPLARRGFLDVLLGHPETAWLDVKSQGYDLAEDFKRVELARDVAAFANSEHGGILLVGASTRSIGGTDVITKVAPVPVDSINPRRYRAVIDARVVPPVEHLGVEAVRDSTSHGYLIITIPPQPEQHKPFLVHGAVVAKRVEGTYISVVRRRGEDNMPINAISLHSMLAAGRAALARPSVPEVPGEPDRGAPRQP